MNVEQLVQRIKKLEENIKAINASIKDLKPKSEDIEALKKQRRDISKQIKDMDADIEREMNEDMDIVEFKKEKIGYEEELAEVKQNLFEEIAKMNQEFSIDVQCEDGMVKVQTMKGVRLFWNGKELVNKVNK